MLTMTDVQLDLLQKLNELCQKADVKYVLHGHAAFLAYSHQPFDYINSIEVLMCQGDAEKITNILDDDRYYFEDFRSNPKFDRHYMMFGFKNSIDLKKYDLNFTKTRNLKNQCIRITIHFIEQPPDKFAKKILRANRKLSNRHLETTSYDYNNFQRKQKICKSIFKIIGDDYYNKKLYNFKKRSISINTWDDIKEYPLIKITGKRPMESDIFNSISRVEIGNTYSFIFKEFERYAEHCYGKNWQENEWPLVNKCTSAIICWQEYSKDPKVQESIDKIQKNHELIHEQYAETRDYRKVVRAAKRQIMQSESVIHTREKYIKEKKDIIKLYQSGNIDELGEVLKPLIYSMKNGIRRGYTYSVDEEIDDILDSYLISVDRKQLADKIKSYRIDI